MFTRVMIKFKKFITFKGLVSLKNINLFPNRISPGWFLVVGKHNKEKKTSNQKVGDIEKGTNHRFGRF